MNIVGEYTNYLLKSKGRHGTHSPFVYGLMDNYRATKINQDDLSKIKARVKQLKASDEKIEIFDFGAGSKKLNNFRTTRQILKNSSSFGKYGELLYKLNSIYKFGNILEFGTSIGIGTSFLSLANDSSKIVTVEACRNTRNKALETFDELNLTNINSILSTFNDYLDSKPEEIFDCIYIDGHHDGEALLKYIEALDDLSHDDTLFILDDIRWSDSMLNAWNTIKSDPKYHLTMDFFRFGIIAKRKKQEKEHFILKKY